MLKATFKGSYRSKGLRNPATKGQLRFSYAITGSEQELKAFKDAQGDFYVADESGTPISNQLNFLGKQVNMIQTRDGKFIPDTSALDQASSLAKQHPWLASEIAKTLVAGLGLGSSVSAPVAVKEGADLGK